jgi:hypothetical protein
MAEGYLDEKDLVIPLFTGSDLFKSELKEFIKVRGISKRRITNVFKFLNEKREAELISQELLDIQIGKINNILLNISESNEKILCLYDKYKIPEIDGGMLDNEISDQDNYEFNINDKLAYYIGLRNKSAFQRQSAESGAESGVNSKDLAGALNAFKFNINPPRTLM